MGEGLAVEADLDGGEDAGALGASCKVVGGLLVVQARDEEERVQPGGAAVEGGSLGEGTEVGEDEEPGGGEAEVGDGVTGPAGYEGNSRDGGLRGGLDGGSGGGHLAGCEEFTLLPTGQRFLEERRGGEEI